MYTLQGKTWPTQHVRFPRQSMYTRRTLPTGGPRMWQPFMSHQQSRTESLLLRKKAPDTTHSTSADRSIGLYPVSHPSQPMKQWRKPNIYQHQATRLTGPISPACNWYVQYLLMGANPSVLNRHRRGYNPGGVGLPHTTLWPSQPAVSTFHLRTLPSLQFNQALSTKPRCWVLK
jgi:hypothetical protein